MERKEGGREYLDSARTRGGGKEAPWFAGEEDEEKDQKKHKEKKTDNAH